MSGDYRNEVCLRCGRMRVESDGICEKCGWDNDEGKWSERRTSLPENPLTLGEFVSPAKHPREEVEQMLARGEISLQQAKKLVREV